MTENPTPQLAASARHTVQGHWSAMKLSQASMHSGSQAGGPDFCSHLHHRLASLPIAGWRDHQRPRATSLQKRSTPRVPGEQQVTARCGVPELCVFAEQAHCWIGWLLPGHRSPRSTCPTLAQDALHPGPSSHRRPNLYPGRPQDRSMPFAPTLSHTVCWQHCCASFAQYELVGAAQDRSISAALCV